MTGVGIGIGVAIGFAFEVMPDRRVARPYGLSHPCVNQEAESDFDPDSDSDSDFAPVLTTRVRGMRVDITFAGSRVLPQSQA